MGRGGEGQRERGGGGRNVRVCVWSARGGGVGGWNDCVYGRAV